MPSIEQIAATFIEGAPPGELAEVLQDIKALTPGKPNLVADLQPAFRRYGEEQLATVQLPGGNQQVIISKYSALGGDRYFDVERSISFTFDCTNQTTSAVQSYVVESAHLDLIKSISKSLPTYVKEHFSSGSCGVYPAENDSKVAIVIVANKYSPKNFWSGRWRSVYLFDPASNSLDGTVRVDVHYYEDGNVRLLTQRAVTATAPGATGAAIVREIATAERAYQEELNRGFTHLSEGAFKGLRRQLPVTRQKIEWDKITSYRVGQDIGGGSLKR